MQTLRIILLGFICLFFAQGTWANENVFEHTVNRPIAEVYDAVYKGLEAEHLWVIFEPNIGKNLANFAGKWGEEYNRNKLTAIRSLVFCSPWYANQVSNADPAMLSFCPLHVTLYEKDGHTTAVFLRPGRIASSSPAHKLLTEVEQLVIKVLRTSM